MRPCEDSSSSQHTDCSLGRELELRNARENLFHTNINQRKFVLLYQVSNRKDFKAKNITIDREVHHNKCSIHQEDIMTATFHAPNLYSLINCEAQFNRSQKTDKCTIIMGQILYLHQ